MTHPLIRFTPLKLVFSAATTIAVMTFAAWASAQDSGLPPIFKDTRIALRPALTVAELPKNTFLENLVFEADGRALITSHEDGKIYQRRPGGSLAPWAQVPGKIAGIALAPGGDVIASGSAKSGVATLFRVNRAGQASTALSLPDAIFLNGLVHLAEQRYLVADSYKGVIWLADLGAGRAQVWLADPLLARADDKSPLPAINGMKLAGQRLIVSNTAKQLLVEITLDAQGRPGAPKVLHERLNVDDFAIDSDGTIYATTHVYNSLIRISPGGQVEILAGREQGMAGSTAAAFGLAPGDTRNLYVTTNGGMFLPPPTGVESGKLVRVSIEPR